MLDNTWYFGTLQKMMVLRLPDTGMGRKWVGYSESLQFENGGADVYQPSAGAHLEYEIDYGLYEAKADSPLRGLDNYADYAAGLYGVPSVVYFADPMYYDINLFPPQWAAPGLMEAGWRKISATAGITYANTLATPWGHPYRCAVIDTFSTSTTLLTPSNQSCVIPIPPGYTLWLGASGAATGAGVVRVENWLNGASSPASSSNLTLISANLSTRLNASVASTSANYVRVGVATSTVQTSGTVTLVSMMAQLWPTGVTPTLTGNFQSGQGNNGCKFNTDAVAEKYILRDNMNRNVHYKGLSFGLTEVYR